MSAAVWRHVYSFHCRDGRLIGEAQQDDSRWTTSWDSAETGRWYFVELSWSRRTGLTMYVDLQLVDSDASPQHRQQVDADDGHAYLGADVTRSNHASATVDDLQLWFGERSKLIELDFLLRGTYMYTIVRNFASSAQ